MMIRSIAIALAMVSLAGCFGEPKAMSQPAMAIAPGFIRLDSGKLVQVIGYERCPGSGYSLIGRIETRSMQKHCTIVNKDDSAFEISVGTAVGMVVERWTVLADSRSIKLVRPDGDGATVFRLAKRLE